MKNVCWLVGGVEEGTIDYGVGNILKNIQLCWYGD